MFRFGEPRARDVIEAEIRETNSNLHSLEDELRQRHEIDRKKFEELLSQSKGDL